MKVKIFGKRLPIWLLVLALIGAGAGAATGTVLAGKVSGKMPVTASQAVLVSGVDFSSLPGGTPHIATVADDGTGFTAGVELHNGDEYKVEIALKNLSESALYVKLTLWGVPCGITVSADDTDDASSICRVGRYTWMFKLNPTTDSSKDVVLTIALADNMKPGFYEIKGKIEPVNY